MGVLFLLKYNLDLNLNKSAWRARGDNLMNYLKQKKSSGEKERSQEPPKYFPSTGEVTGAIRWLSGPAHARALQVKYSKFAYHNFMVNGLSLGEEPETRVEKDRLNWLSEVGF